MEKIVKFEFQAKRDILHFFNKDINKEGYVIEKDTGDIVPDTTGEPIEEKDFVGIRNGSLIFIKSDINSIIELSDSLTS